MTTTHIPELVQQKLEAFEGIQTECERCFCFTQDVHGQQRFSSFGLEHIVFYLHSLWLCELKDRLLSIYKNIHRYDGERSLKLLQTWQSGDNAGVAAFLLRKLEIQSIADFTAQIDRAHQQRADEALLGRLTQGRQLQLNRAANLMHALEALSTSPVAVVQAEVSQFCARYGHAPAQVDAQLAQLALPVCAYRPHALLAQKNMMFMNRLDINVLAWEAGTPARVFDMAESPQAPFAEQVIPGYLEMLAPTFNNVRGVRFVDRTEKERE